LRPNGLRACEVVAARGGGQRVVAVGSQLWLPTVATLLWVMRRCWGGSRLYTARAATSV
jgi:hypothetical protein